MATYLRTKELSAKIRVALIIERGRLKPVWFEETDKPGRGRIFIKEICSIWHHREGTARIINFSVSDGANCYRLSLNSQEFTWTLGIAEGSPFT